MKDEFPAPRDPRDPIIHDALHGIHELMRGLTLAEAVGVLTTELAHVLSKHANPNCADDYIDATFALAIDQRGIDAAIDLAVDLREQLA